MQPKFLDEIFLRARGAVITPGIAFFSTGTKTTPQPSVRALA